MLLHAQRRDQIKHSHYPDGFSLDTDKLNGKMKIYWCFFFPNEYRWHWNTKAKTHSVEMVSSPERQTKEYEMESHWRNGSKRESRSFLRSMGTHTGVKPTGLTRKKFQHTPKWRSVSRSDQKRQSRKSVGRS